MKGRSKVKLGSRKPVGRAAGYGSLALIGVIGLALLFPVAGSSANAEGEPLTNIARMKAETYVYSTLAVSLSDGVNLDITPKASGSFASGEAELKVTTNNTTGYAVYMQTGDNTSSLKPANGMVEAEIGPIVGEMTAANFATHLNTWGYAVTSGGNAEGLKYKAIPSAQDSAIITTDKLTAEDNYTLGFATAVGADLPAGKYYNSVIVSVVANPIAVHTLSGITYMQEMSPYVCDYSDENETKQLIDSRDGKSYWVAKLKDGNCWMTQNLALDLDTNEAGNAVAVSEDGKTQELSSSNTDISGVWHEYAPSKTETNIPEASTLDYVATRSWNLGKVVLTSPTSSKHCDNIGTGGNITDCEWYKDVSNWTADADVLSETSSIDETAERYNPHYLVGDYYQWNTATAGSAIGVTGTPATNSDGAGLTNATESICPKGWQLPKSGRNTSTETLFGIKQGESYDIDGSFYHLLKVYGYTKWSSSGGNGFFTISTGEKRMDYEPMYFVRSGAISTSAGNLNNIANYGTVWSSTLYYPNEGYSYAIYYDTVSVPPSDAHRRPSGLSVRCLAR